MIRLRRLPLPRSLLLAFLALLAAISLDVLSTLLALASGHAHEANPLAAHFLFSGVAFLLLAKILSLLFAFALIFLIAWRANARVHRLITLAFIALALVFFLVSLSNLSVTYFGYDFFTFFARPH